MCLLGLAACAVDQPEPELEVETQEASATPNWVSSFRDEFTGTTLDRSKWATRYKWGGQTLPNHNELQCYVDENVSVAGGTLRLRAERRTVTCANAPHPYASGMVSADAGMSQLHGYFEMRARLPRGAGFWPAF